MEKKETEDKNTYRNVLREILNQEKPFCLIDIYHRLKEKGITDEGLILHVLDKAYEEGLVEYKEVDIPGYKGWAFVIPKD